MKKLLLVVSLILLTLSSAYSQSLKLGLSGGLTNVTAPDSYTEDISKGGFGFSSEIHYGVKAKLSLPLIPLTFAGYIINHSLNSDESGAEYSLNVLAIGVGAEWALIPGPVSPYLGVDVLSNSFGDLELNGNTAFDGDSRVGAAVGAGIDFKLLPKFDIDASVKYNMFNLIGQDDNEDTISSLNLNVTILFSVI